MKSINQFAQNNNHIRILSAVMRVAVFVLLAKIVGAVKEILIANRYGVSEVVDAYQFTQNIALWLPSTLSSVLLGAVLIVLVNNKYKPADQRNLFLRELMGLTLLLSVLMGIIVWLAWPWALDLSSADLTVPMREYSQSLIRVFAPVAFFMIMTIVLVARLRSYERHINNVLDALPAIGIIICLFLMPADKSEMPLFWGTLIGFAALYVSLQLLVSKVDPITGMPRLGFSSEDWKDLSGAMSLIFISQIIISVTGPFDQFILASLPNNANAVAGYASKVLALITGLAATSVARSVLPVLLDLYAQGEKKQVHSITMKWAFSLFVIGLICVVIGWQLAPWMVSLLFERGAFTAHDTQVVAQALRWGLWQLPFFFCSLILVQLIMTKKRYVVMCVVAVFATLAKVITTYALMESMQVAAVFISTAIMYLVYCVGYLYDFVRRKNQYE